MIASSNASRDKLGLAFAGGGFRASLFHLGVLYRLAELDVLRHVQILSTVSGGSIVGATYVMRLKKWLEQKGPDLTTAQYRELVQEVDEVLCAGIDANLRTRLFLNPLRTLRVMLTHESLGRTMARLYERHILHEAIMRDAGAPARHVTPLQRMNERKYVRDQLQLRNLRIHPKGASLEQGIDAYNNAQAAVGGSVVTSIVINATTLNSGGRFFFSGVELGDYYLGQFRRDEFDALKARRQLLLHDDVRELEASVNAAAAVDFNQPASSPADVNARSNLRMRSLAVWWRKLCAGETPQTPDGWEKLFTHPALTPFPGELANCATGLLRQAKLSAWYLRYGYNQSPPITGGQTREAHWLRVLAVLTDIDRALAANIHASLDPQHEAATLLLEFIVELYLLRTAEHMSDKFDRDWANVTIADAVGASACFPPVFPPFVLLGIYDDAHVTRLGLSDGGAYDNVGITGLMDEDCTSVIASDTAGMFDQLRAAPAGHLGMILRLPNILMNALGGFQRLVLREQKRTSREIADIGAKVPETADCKPAHDLLARARAAHDLQDLAYFNMAAPAPPLPDSMVPPITTGIDRQKLARIRTDLDCFGEIERAALVNDGYDTADRFARGFLDRYALPEWKTEAPRAPKPLVQGAHAEKVLDAGAARMIRALMVRAPVSMIACALAGIALGAAALVKQIRIAALWRAFTVVAVGFGHGFARALESMLGPIGRAIIWTVQIVPHYLPRVLFYLTHAPITLLVLGAAVIWWGFSLGRKPHPPTRRAKYVWLQTAKKWAASLVGNVLWFVWALPLIVVVVVTMVTAVGWVLLYWPWRASARIRASGVVALPATPPPPAPSVKQAVEMHA